jgi:hypothetical protein
MTDTYKTTCAPMHILDANGQWGSHITSIDINAMMQQLQ